MNIAKVMTKIAALPRILEAAKLLHDLRLLNEQPAAVVKRYVEANPDINDALAKHDGYRDGAEPPLAAASVTNIGNCFIESNVDIATASG